MESEQAVFIIVRIPLLIMIGLLVRLAKRIQEHNRLNPYFPEDEEEAEEVVHEDNDGNTKITMTIRYNDQPEEQEKSETETTTKWIKHEYMFDGDVYECSRCGAKYRESYPRCPNCESRMKRIRRKRNYIAEGFLMDTFLGDK